MTAAPSRPSGSSGGASNALFVMFGVVLVLATVVLLGVQVSVLVRHGRVLSVGLAESLQALVRLPAHITRPAAAWPVSAQRRVPGPFIYWPATLAVAAAMAAIAVKIVPLIRADMGGVGTAQRSRLGVDPKARLARKGDLRPLVVKHPLPGRLIVGTVDGRLVATERRDPSTPASRRRSRAGRIGDRSAVLVVGPTRCGKTANLISAVLDWDGPCVLSSVKADLLAATIKARRTLGDVKIFDPTGCTVDSRSGRELGPLGSWSPLRAAHTLQGAMPRHGQSSTPAAVLVGRIWCSSVRKPNNSSGPSCTPRPTTTDGRSVTWCRGS